MLAHLILTSMLAIMGNRAHCPNYGWHALGPRCAAGASSYPAVSQGYGLSHTTYSKCLLIANFA
jgi:hypothetical protein